MAASQVMIMAEPIPPNAGRIFISYRREEARYPASWLFSRLAERFGAAQIFKDVDSIKPGDDFVERITAAVASCAVLLAVIGDEWLTIADEQGRRRLDDRDDFVRLEIEAALQRKIRVIPVLVEGVEMPRAEQLPASLAGLARKQALVLSPNRFVPDTDELLAVLDDELKTAMRTPEPEQFREPSDVAERPPPRTGWWPGLGSLRAAFGQLIRSTRGRWIAGILMVTVLALVAAGIVMTTRDRRSPPDQDPRLVAQLDGAMRGITSVALNSDGTLVAGASSDHTVRLWNPATGRLIGQPLAAHFDQVMCVAFSTDGKVLASGSWDRTVRLWNPATGQPIGQPLGGHIGIVTSLAFSPDGTILASASDDATVRLWNPATGQSTGPPLLGHRGGVNTVAFSPDGKTLASGGEDHTARLWNPATGQPIGQPLTAHSIRVTSVDFSPDGTILATGSDDQTIRLWNPATGEPIGQPLAGHASGVTGVAFSPDGTIVASGSWDGTVRLWDPATGEPVDTPLTGHTEKITAVAFGRDATMLATGSWDRTVRVWKVRSGP